MSDGQKAFKDLVDELGIAVESVFVPLSKSRNAGERHPTLNWKVTVTYGGGTLLCSDYQAGCAHAPSYKNGYRSASVEVMWECENGRAYGRFGKRIEPNKYDVIWSLVSDAGALDYASFNAWAGDYGYYVDSRKAESIYRACLDIGLALRNRLGEENFRRLREASYEY